MSLKFKQMKMYCLMMICSVFLFQNAKSQIRFNLNSVRPGKYFEFHQYPMIAECKDPHKMKFTFLNDKKVKINSWYKGCPNNRISQEELIYDYEIVDGADFSLEYNWMRIDTKVLLISNNSAGYSNGYYKLEKKYIISNVFNGKYFIDAKILNQLDPKEYPSRNGVYIAGGK